MAHTNYHAKQDEEPFVYKYFSCMHITVFERQVRQQILTTNVLSPQIVLSLIQSAETKTNNMVLHT